jgi:hypothetical protein
MPLIEELTATGEIAEFIDDDQFGWGQSTMKCGYEIISLFWHSTRPRTKNLYSSQQIHEMAHLDYLREVGPDTTADRAGMTNQQLYADLDYHRFKYVKLPRDWKIIRLYIKYGYPVVIGGVAENSVYDLAIGDHVPYPWIKPGVNYYHIIMATGLDGDYSIRARDTANVDARGALRKGPRLYSTIEMQYTTATALVPTWLPLPPVGLK